MASPLMSCAAKPWGWWGNQAAEIHDRAGDPATVPAHGGRSVVEGEDLCILKGEKCAKMRRRMQMIFQDPMPRLIRA